METHQFWKCSWGVLRRPALSRSGTPLHYRPLRTCAVSGDIFGRGFAPAHLCGSARNAQPYSTSYRILVKPFGIVCVLHQTICRYSQFTARFCFRSFYPLRCAFRARALQRATVARARVHWLCGHHGAVALGSEGAVGSPMNICEFAQRS